MFLRMSFISHLLSLTEWFQDDSEEVFGKNLNKKKTDLKLSTIPFHAKEWADITPVRLCHGQRPKKRADKSPTKEKATEDNVDKVCWIALHLDHKINV